MSDVAVGTVERPATPHSLVCNEVWGANSNVAHSVELPGLQGWVYSAPIELGQNGGDIHYLSVCSEGVLCRVALADVSGHGRAVSAVAERLLALMRRHINHVEQGDFLRELSESLDEVNGADRVTFATALVVGFDASSGAVVFTNAGHPAPLWYHAAEGRWDWLRQTSVDSSASPVGLPLGIAFGSGYADVVIQLAAGDVLICYTDGLIEGGNDNERQIDSGRLMDLAYALPVESPMATGATLLGLVDAWRRGQPAGDDETLIVLQRPRLASSPSREKP